MNENSRFEKYYVFFLAMIAAIPAMSTDMYVAAISQIAILWQVPESKVALSLVLWFVSFSVFLLILGPLSDKLGRRRILLAGLAVFIVSSFLCAMAAGVYQLIIFRILQGASAAAPSSMCMAICRDKFDGNRRKHVLAYIGIILSVMPMVAPLIGASLMRYMSWRMIFVVQALLSIFALVISFNYKETLKSPALCTTIKVLARYGNLIKNTNYLFSNMTMGLILGPFYGFITFSAIVYMKIFGLDPLHFSMLFALNAFMSMSGAYTCTRLTRYITDLRLLTICFLGCLCGGLGIVFFGHIHYLAFAAPMCLYTFCCGLSRPLSNNIILEQVTTDIGSASSFIVFYQFIIGAACMALVARQWQNPVFAFGLLAVSVPLFILCCWPFLCARLRR
jgi:MFS transporter, DHA1 family, multidrug resistance protein